MKISKMNLRQAREALRDEEYWKANGISYSTRRLGDLRRRIKSLEPTPEFEVKEEEEGGGPHED